MKRFRLLTYFYAALFPIKTCFYQNSKFLLQELDTFSQNLDLSESSI